LLVIVQLGKPLSKSFFCLTASTLDRYATSPMQKPYRKNSKQKSERAARGRPDVTDEKSRGGACLLRVVRMLPVGEFLAALASLLVEPVRLGEDFGPAPAAQGLLALRARENESGRIVLTVHTSPKRTKKSHELCNFFILARKKISCNYRPSRALTRSSIGGCVINNFVILFFAPKGFEMKRCAVAWFARRSGCPEAPIF